MTGEESKKGSLTNVVQHIFISTMNPHANGLVKRVNRIIKSALHRIGSKCPEGKLWEALGAISHNLWVLPTRTIGYVLYVHVIKTAMALTI